MAMKMKFEPPIIEMEFRLRRALLREIAAEDESAEPF
jgi:hypothetical protein